MVKEWWNRLKQKGSSHYKSGDNFQPIDLYVSGGGFRFFCAYSIIKYAFRQRTKETGGDENRLRKDIEKIKHYADLLLCSEVDTELEKPSKETVEQWMYKAKWLEGIEVPKFPKI